MAFQVISNYGENRTDSVPQGTVFVPNSSFETDFINAGDAHHSFSGLFSNTSLELLVLADNRTSSGNVSVESEPFVLPRWSAVLWTAVLVSVMGLGLLGNSLVPLVVLRTRDLRTSTNFLLVNLAVADVLVLVVCLPTALTELHTRPNTWVLGAFLCEYTWVLIEFSVSTSNA